MPKVEAFGKEAIETERQAKSLLKGSDEATRLTLDQTLEDPDLQAALA